MILSDEWMILPFAEFDLSPYNLELQYWLPMTHLQDFLLLK